MKEELVEKKGFLKKRQRKESRAGKKSIKKVYIQNVGGPKIFIYDDLSRKETKIEKLNKKRGKEVQDKGERENNGDGRRGK